MFNQSCSVIVLITSVWLLWSAAKWGPLLPLHNYAGPGRIKETTKFRSWFYNFWGAFSLLKVPIRAVTLEIHKDTISNVCLNTVNPVEIMRIISRKLPLSPLVAKDSGFVLIFLMQLFSWYSLNHDRCIE